MFVPTAGRPHDWQTGRSIQLMSARQRPQSNSPGRRQIAQAGGMAMSRAWENSRLTWRLNRCERDPIRPLN